MHRLASGWFKGLTKIAIMNRVSGKSLFWIVWVVPTWILLGLSRAIILLVPFRRLSGCLGDKFDPWPQVPLASPEQIRLAREISRVVGSASRFTPWESNCYTTAITARLLLGLYRIPYLMFLGLRRDDVSGKHKAHAWVVSGAVQVVGGRGFGNFAPVGCFGKYSDADAEADH